MSTEEERLDAEIGVDVGGTHTDVCAIVGSRRERGKALTTYDDFGTGVLEAIGVAATAHGLSLEQLLGRTRLLVNGTTLVSNAVTTLTGSKVGVLVTAGFRDTFRLAGGRRIADFDDHLQLNTPDVVPREALLEVDGRIDWRGVELAVLDLEGVREATRDLVEEQEVDSLAVCFVNSFLNPTHELKAGEAIRDAYPDVFLTLSHDVFPVGGENRRWTTAVLNSFVQEGARDYLDSLHERITAAGLKGRTVFFQGLGGGISLDRAKRNPLALLGSGPAGGALGANALARRMGMKRVLLGDMGGTSFDTGVIVDNDIQFEQNLDIGLLRTGVHLVDVVSVGAGGGSIAWVGERGVPQVGPQGAKSEPGPAAYGKSGTEPTVTDAMVVLGLIDPDRYLGGRLRLYPELAERAFAPLMERFGWTKTEAAVAVHDLMVAGMTAAVREVSVGKGHDPRDFVFLAYGGMLPLFAAQIALGLGISKVVIPQNSSVFCALGLLSADFVVRNGLTVGWDLSVEDRADEVNALIARMVEETRAELRREGFADEDIEVGVSGDFRFLGQSHELSMPLPATPLTIDDVPHMGERFLSLYERTYGEGTAWKGVSTQLLNVTTTGTGRLRHIEPERAAPDRRPEEEMCIGARTVFLPELKETREVPIYSEALFTLGNSLAGPAMIDATDTTIYVPSRTEVTRDEHMNLIMTTPEA